MRGGQRREGGGGGDDGRRGRGKKGGGGGERRGEKGKKGEEEEALPSLTPSGSALWNAQTLPSMESCLPLGAHRWIPLPSFRRILKSGPSCRLPAMAGGPRRKRAPSQGRSVSSPAGGGRGITWRGSPPADSPRGPRVPGSVCPGDPAWGGHSQQGRVRGICAGRGRTAGGGAAELAHSEPLPPPRNRGAGPEPDGDECCERRVPRGAAQVLGSAPQVAFRGGWALGQVGGTQVWTAGRWSAQPPAARSLALRCPSGPSAFVPQEPVCSEP